MVLVLGQVVALIRVKGGLLYCLMDFFLLVMVSTTSPIKVLVVYKLLEVISVNYDGISLYMAIKKLLNFIFFIVS